MTENGYMTEKEYIEAIGYISAELAARADAWNGNAPEWFPEPPEWLKLAQDAREATREEVTA
jgi:hypothetical protein